MKGVNVPPAPQRPGTNVAHAALVFLGGDFAGDVYVTREGSVWYQLGTTRYVLQKRTEAAIASVLGHAPDHSAGEFYKIGPAALVALIANGGTIVSCF